ncbi:MAG TPA: CHAP domain-containing protein [Abditibacterium sp.]
MKTHIIDGILSVTRAELGVRESDNNSGPRVQQYQSVTTLGGTHWPWCAAFVAWVLMQVARKLGIDIPWSNSASCDVILADARARGLIRQFPQAGDVFLVRARTKNGFSNHDMIHTGIVETVRTDGTFTEIAGNTNSDGGREGIGVMRTTRKIDGRCYFVRVVDGISAEAIASLDPKSAPAIASRPWTASIQLAQGASGGSVRGLPTIHIDNQLFIHIRKWGEATGQSVVYDKGNHAVRLDGEEVPVQARMVDGDSYYPLELLCEMSGGFLMRNEANRTAKAVFS